MGIYLFKTDVLLKQLKQDDKADFGKHILPAMLRSKKVVAYPYKRKNRIRDVVVQTNEEGVRGETIVEKARDSGYWRDVGTLDAYWNANMDLTGVDPVKTVFAQMSDNTPRAGVALDSLVAHGSILSGGLVINSVLSYNVFVQSWASVEESVVMENVVIGRRARIKKAIIAEGVHIPPHTEIGFHPDVDKEHFVVTPRGITVVTKENLPDR